MAMMETMLGDMLKKAIPPEVAALLTKEKVEELGNKINGFLVDVRQKLDVINEKQNTILSKLEALGNVGSDDSRAIPYTPAFSGDGIVHGDGDTAE